jgi:nucleotide-binding universal stress UspA family protein
MFELKRIVCPTDFSEGAEQAISQASELAQRSGAEICLVHVIRTKCRKAEARSKKDIRRRPGVSALWPAWRAGVEFQWK